MAVQVGRSVVSFTIKNIDVDRKMRERLKREIAPLLSCNRNKDLSGKTNKQSTNSNQNNGGSSAAAAVTGSNVLQIV